MKRHPTTFRIRSVAVFLLITFVLIANSPSIAQQANGKPSFKIVQLGDSYSAGNGARSASEAVQYLISKI